MRFTLFLPFLFACGGCDRTVYEDTDTDPAPEDTGLSEADWSRLDAAFDAAGPDAPPTGMTLVVWNAEGDVLYRRTWGGFEPDVYVPVASASKWISGLTLLRLVHEGVLSLDDTTGEVLGFDGPQADITLDHLGGFVSGWEGKELCTYNPATTLQGCAARFDDRDVVAPPGEYFEYANSHLAVAGAMAEVQTGQAWNDLFRTRLAARLDLTDPSLRYYTSPKQAQGDENPLVAGGLHASVDAYREFLLLVLNEGRHGGEEVIAPALIDRFFQNPYGDATVGDSPAVDLDAHYGFTSWQECPTTAPTCDLVSSAGAFGLVPWVDRERGYAAILAMEGEVGTSQWAVPVQQELLTLLEEQLDRD